MKIADIIHNGNVQTRNWIIHLTDFREVTTITCDDCIDQKQANICDFATLRGDERKDKINSIITECYGIDDLPGDANICEMAHTDSGAYLYILTCNDYRDVMAVIEGEAGGMISYDDPDDAIKAFFDLDR